MAPFHNKGWEHFDKICEIILNANARGSYTFLPMNAIAPGQLRDNEAEAQTATATVTTTTSNHNKPADFDKDGDGMTLISTVTSKLHKLPSTTVDDDDSYL